MADEVLYEVERGRARITLNRPERHNALTDGMQRVIGDFLWQADDDTTVHAVVIRGNGPSFCSGYALGGAAGAGRDAKTSRGRQTFDDDVWQLERLQRWRMTPFDMHKPVVAQVHGACLAGGTDLVLYCDLVIAADDARFGFPAARDLGSLPSQMWLYHVGPQWAKRLLLTGDSITGTEAAAIGLALKAVPVAQLEDEVEQLLDRFALIHPDLLTANKRIVNLGLELMGARTLQRLAIENDARAHRTPAFDEFGRRAREHGLKEAMRMRDAPFGDGRARVRGPEVRDDEGRLVDDKPEGQ